MSAWCRLAFVLSLIAVVPLRAQFEFSFDEGTRRWTLHNGAATATLELQPSGGLSLASFRNTATGEEWTTESPYEASPVRMALGGFGMDGNTAFRLVSQSARAVPRNGYRQTIVLEDLRGLGRWQVELEMYAGHPVLRYRVRFRNLQGSPAVVSMADLLPWSFAADGHTFRAFRVNQWVFYGKEGNFEPLEDTLHPGMRVTLTSGAHGQHCGWLAVRDEADRGLFAGWEFDGRADVHVGRTEDALTLAGQIRSLYRRVGPNEEFVVPFAFLGVFHGDWDEAGYQTQRFTEAALARPMPDADFPYVIWDSWRYQTDLDESVLRQEAAIAASLGVEVFVLDLGWSRAIGDWRHDPRKFPGGLHYFSDYVHSLGMKFGLHFAFAEAAPNSPVLRQHPDWTSSKNHNYFDADSLCLSHQPVRDWIVAEAVRMIDEYNVDWILQDGENMVKDCWKSTHTHDPLDSNYSNAVDGLNYVVSAIQRQRPNVSWENCEDGGNMMTFNMSRRYVTSIAADDSGPLVTRQAIYGVTYPFSPRYADRYMPDEELDTYATRSSMFGGPWVFMNRLTRMRPQDLEFASQEIAIFKRIRGHIRDGKVFHLTGRPTETTWDALESYNAATDSAIVFVHRPEAPAGQRTLRLRGLNAGTRYRVRFQDDRRTLTATGGQLMERGLLVRLPSMWTSEIVYVEPIR